MTPRTRGPRGPVRTRKRPKSVFRRLITVDAIVKAVSVSVQTEQNQRASFPPSTATETPVIKDALSDARNTMVSAISSAVPTRFTGTPEIKAALFSAVPVNRFTMPVSIGSWGDYVHAYAGLRHLLLLTDPRLAGYTCAKPPSTNNSVPVM